MSDPRRPRLLATLSGHTDAVTSVTFSPDGHTLATGGNDFTIRTRETRRDKATARICDSAHPRLTRAEWAQYFTAVGPVRRFTTYGNASRAACPPSSSDYRSVQWGRPSRRGAVAEVSGFLGVQARCLAVRRAARRGLGRGRASTNSATALGAWRWLRPARRTPAGARCAAPRAPRRRNCWAPPGRAEESRGVHKWV
ncbi:WD40 repeat domain-containing protein [Streptomyces sp. NPDC056682]|uniref:WD40 repeat domain-containing protein n=1 Tax=Streptomyces sp. NPDC056682 TaxID=3345909 RepID=UPI0036C64279